MKTTPLTQATRRQLLAGSAAAALCPSLALAQPDSALRGITVLYRREETDALTRLEVAPQSAAAQLEEEFSRAGMKVYQPSPEAYRILDQGPEMVVNFDANAGASIVFAVAQSKRPRPGDMMIVEVRVRAKVFIGPTILVTGAQAEGVGKVIVTTPGPDGERRGLEEAARAGAREAAAKILPRLKALSAADIEARMHPVPSVVAGGTVVSVPRPQATQPVVADPNAPLPPPKRRFALLVGVSDYTRVNKQVAGEFKMGNLPGVAIDINNLYESMQKLGFEKGRIKRLENAEATSANVRKHLMTLAGELEPDDLVLVAFSAHGASREYSMSGYGLPILDDFRGTSDANAIDFWQVQALVGQLPANQVVLMVDTCHSGGVANRMPRLTIQANGNPTVSSGTVVPEPARMAADVGDPNRHYLVLAAAQPDELSLEASPNGGLFTSTLLRALRGGAGKQPVSQVFQGQVVTEVVEASQKMCRKMGGCKVQTPVLAYSGRGNMIRL